MNTLLNIQNISKAYGTQTVLSEVNLKLLENSVLSLLGASGSGKTTLLKIISGLEKQDRGDVFLKDECLNQVPTSKRRVLYLYQEALLFPHLNVFENIAFGLRLKNVKDAVVRERTEALAEKLGVATHLKKMPSQLSGGERQRVSFGRAMITEPSVLLLDEPFGALDDKTRSKMQDLFKELVSSLKIGAIFVTHDLKEAIIMGDQLARIHQGSLKQYDDKKDFFEDRQSGVQDEIAFWKRLDAETP